MVIIEAMARSKPVVAARVGGIPELITHGETGLLIERTPVELADALVRLLANPDLRRTLGQNGLERARSHFSARIMVDHIEALYCEMLACSRAS